MGDKHRTQYHQFLSDVPTEVLLNVFPFKVVFHVQTALHASLNIAPQFLFVCFFKGKKERKFN